jgi:23S rRNA pseudouridine1911/1915/1917 synthase
MTEYKISPDDLKQRIDVWMTLNIGVTRGVAQRMIKDELVTINGNVLRSSYTLRKDDVVMIKDRTSVAKKAHKLNLPIIYEDDDVVIIDKPAPLVVHPARADSTNPSVVDFIRPKTSDDDPDRPGIVHRLDSDTSGVLILAKNIAAKQFLQDEFKKRLVEKKYLALVIGRLKEKNAIIKLALGRSSNDPLKRVPTVGGKDAETEYKVLEEYDGFSLIEVSPKTGRTHQIRAHFAALGHPIAADSRYGGMSTPKSLKRHFLHASSLKLTLPSGKVITAEAPLPDELEAVLSDLREK